MFKICVSQVQLCLLDSDCSRRCFWPLLSYSSVLSLTRAVFLSWCLSGNEEEAAMTFWCQLAPCHVIVVKWGCNNRNNMFLAQFKPLLRCSFYLRGGGGRICDSLHVSAGSLYPSNLACGKPGASGKAAANFTVMCSLAAGRSPPKWSLSTRRAAGPPIHLPQLSVPSGVWAVDGSESARRHWSTRTACTRGEGWLSPKSSPLTFLPVWLLGSRRKLSH